MALFLVKADNFSYLEDFKKKLEFGGYTFKRTICPFNEDNFNRVSGNPRFIVFGTGTVLSHTLVDNEFTFTDATLVGTEYNLPDDWADAIIKAYDLISFDNEQPIRVNDLYDTFSDTPQVNSDWNSVGGLSQILNKPTLSTVATSGSYTDLTSKPTLSTVATSGSYTDLTSKPTIPTLTSQLSNDSNYTSFTSGTSFPVSPIDKQIFWRTDYKAFFYYDVSTWKYHFVSLNKSGLSLTVGATTAEVLLKAVLIPKELVYENAEIEYLYSTFGSVNTNNKSFIVSIADNNLGTVNRVDLSTVTYTTQPFRVQKGYISFKNSLTSQMSYKLPSSDQSFGGNNAASGLLLSKNFGVSDFYLCFFARKLISTGDSLGIDYLKVDIS